MFDATFFVALYAISSFEHDCSDNNNNSEKSSLNNIVKLISD